MDNLTNAFQDLDGDSAVVTGEVPKLINGRRALARKKKVQMHWKILPCRLRVDKRCPVYG